MQQSAHNGSKLEQWCYMLVQLSSPSDESNTNVAHGAENVDG